MLLFLAPPPPDGYAVIVWLHSGDFTSGNASELSPFHLVFKQKLMVVTVAYRLGIFGFFTTMDFGAPGNFGLMDQSAALLWISRNIKLFGGNDKSVSKMTTQHSENRQQIICSSIFTKAHSIALLFLTFSRRSIFFRKIINFNYLTRNT